jgi:hypothetical protein
MGVRYLGGCMQSHGELILEWKKDLLIVYPKGPFNEEGALDAIQSLKNAVLFRNIDNWARLEVWEEDTLGSPKVMNDVKELYLWCSEHGCLATAVVVKNSVQSSLVEKHFSGNIGLFNNEKEAIDWLTKYSDT